MANALFDTVFPADTVEFCPHPDHLDIFVCGTYKLDDPTAGKQHRQGQCLVFQVSDAGRGFIKIQEIALPAVLDIKWCHRLGEEHATLAIADSEGNITLFELGADKRLVQTQILQCATSDVLCLSIDWSNRRSRSSQLGNLIVSLSNGSLSLLRPSAAGLSVSDTWSAHDYEPWIAAWNYWDTNVVYSGGDDLKMKGWDIREDFSQPTFVNKRFEAGITSIQSHPHAEHILAVGSYDNSARIFDTRKPLVPLCKADVGGGAWRVKWHPSPERKNDLLVACMHDGFKVVRFGEYEDIKEDSWEIVKRFDGHESLAYGVDWSHASNRKDEETLVGSCSFYDHALGLWNA